MTADPAGAPPAQGGGPGRGHVGGNRGGGQGGGRQGPDGTGQAPGPAGGAQGPGGLGPAGKGVPASGAAPQGGPNAVGGPPGGGPPAAGPPAGAAPDPGTTPQQPPPSRAAEGAVRVKGADFTAQSEEIKAATLSLQGPTAAGDFVLGDKTEVRYELRFGSAGTPFRAYRVDEEERAAAFVPPPGFQALQDAVTDQVVVVLLSGPAGHGKSAALLRLLTSGPSGTDKVFRLEPSTDLSTLTCDEVPRGAVLLLDDLPAASLDMLEDWVLKRLEAQLRDHGCRLGLTTTAAGRKVTTGAGCVVLELPSRPRPSTVYEQHLAQLLLTRPDARTALRAQPELDELLRDHVDDAQPLRAVARLARMVAAVADDPPSAARRLREQLSGYADEECAQWFRQLGDLKANCLAVSLAVLDGLSREAIAREAERLEDLLTPQPDTVIAPPQPVNPFAVAASVSPARLRAEVMTEVRPTPLGDVRAQVLRYTERGFAGRVLRHVWREHDWIRGPLSTWLNRLGRAPEMRVRVRAATAVGVLANESLEFLTDEVIERWARDDDPEVRDSAAIAFGPVLADAALSSTIRALIKDWSKASGTTDAVRLRATAARAYGATIGLRSPSAALRALADLADDEELDVVVSVSMSYYELVLDAAPALAGRVLHEMDRMVAERKPERRLAGGLGLLALAQTRGIPHAWAAQAPSRRAWPAALVLASERPTAVPVLASLLARTTTDRDLAPLVADTLDEWARACEQDRDLRTTMVDLLVRAAVEPRARTQLARRAQLWVGRREGPAPITGRCLLGRLA